jgi:hypothetical protein
MYGFGRDATYMNLQPNAMNYEKPLVLITLYFPMRSHSRRQKLTVLPVFEERQSKREN